MTDDELIQRAREAWANLGSKRMGVDIDDPEQWTALDAVEQALPHLIRAVDERDEYSRQMMAEEKRAIAAEKERDELREQVELLRAERDAQEKRAVELDLICCGLLSKALKPGEARKWSRKPS